MKFWFFLFLTSSLFADIEMQLLEEDAELTASDIFFSIGCKLNTKYGDNKTFHKNVEKIINAKYSGYILNSIKNADEKFVWDNKLKVFLARYNKNITASWGNSGETPEHPNFAEKDAREVASDMHVVQHDSNFVIFRSRVRIGFTEEKYSYQNVLILLYLDPTSGAKKVTLFASPLNNKSQLFLLPNLKTFPKTNAELSLTNILTAADVTKGVSEGDPPVLDVPFHSYVSETFRFADDKSLQGTKEPYGKALTISEENQKLLEKITTPEATITADEFKTLFQLMKDGVQ